MSDRARVANIAEHYVSEMSRDAGVELHVLSSRTIEREFGWVFFYGPVDQSVLIAGNGPFIVDRRLGAIHPTGTALPLDVQIKTYETTGQASPPCLPSYTVVIEGWKPGAPGFGKISLTKLIRSFRGQNLHQARACTDEVLDGRSVTVTFSTEVEADAFCRSARNLGVAARREPAGQ